MKEMPTIQCSFNSAIFLNVHFQIMKNTSGPSHDSEMEVGVGWGGDFAEQAQGPDGVSAELAVRKAT